MNHKRQTLVRILLALNVTAALLAQASVSADAPRRFSPSDVRVALVVGIGNYESSSTFGGLKHAAKDAQDMKAVLQRLGYKVRFLEDSVTKSRITSAIRELAGMFQAGKPGTFLFFYSGHGVERGGDNYLVPFGVSDSDIVTDGLKVADVEALMRRSGARQRLLIVDACRYSEQSESRAQPPRPFGELQASEGVLAFYASKSGQRSFEDDRLQGGIFTHFVVRGLEGEAAAEDGLISVFDLAKYVTPAVHEYSISRGTPQYPYIVGAGSGDFIVGIRELRREKNSIDGQWYVWVPPGRFMRGCSVGDEECMAIEKPSKEIEISRGFWIGESETTVAAWKRRSSKNQKIELPREDGFGRLLNEAAENDSLPAVAVTWSEARDFCVWAQMTLPSEAQWEYAARSGDRNATYGDLENTAWYGDNSGRKKLDAMQVFRDQNKQFGEVLFNNGNGPHPVGMKQSNRNGLFDVLGNVWEWTTDWFSPDYYRSGAVVDPTGPLGGESKILRGGSWSTYASGVRLSARDRQSPDVRMSDIGFRCAGESLPRSEIVLASPVKGAKQDR